MTTERDGSNITAQAQADIRRTRNDLDQTLSAIERRLAPSALMDDGLDYLRNHGAREYVVNLGEAAKRDPLPLALVGVGIAWLMMSSRRPAAEAAHVSSASAVGSGVMDKVAQTTQKISDTAQAARERARQVGEAAKQGVDRVRSGYGYLLNEQPLALGAIGLALGAALAAGAPRTRQEDQLFGDASDRLTDKAEAAAHETFASARSDVQGGSSPGAESSPATSVSGAPESASPGAWQ